jgi:hypothetical protein
MRYEFHPEDLEEYREAAHWYTDREPGLALQFIASVEYAISRVREAPARWLIIDEDVRRCLTRVFPYPILYPVEVDVLLSCTAENGLLNIQAFHTKTMKES